MVVVGSMSGIIIGGAGDRAPGMFGGACRRAVPRSSSDVQFDKNSPLGKLQDLGTKLEESNKKMEAAQKSGDTNAQAAAAIESLGTLLGGGKRVDPISIDELKPFVPDTFAGLPRQQQQRREDRDGRRSWCRRRKRPTATAPAKTSGSRSPTRAA